MSQKEIIGKTALTQLRTEPETSWEDDVRDRVQVNWYVLKGAILNI